MNHIAPFANRLTELGHSCIVAVPADPRTVEQIDTAYFQPATYQSVLETPNHFPNSKGADILHAWTPREGVRQFVENYTFQIETKVILHLEDNEEQLLESYYRTDKIVLERDGLPPSFQQWEPRLSRPLYWQGFVALADATTRVIDPLKRFICDDTPNIELLPGIDLSLFSPSPPDDNRRKEINILDDEKVIVYPGGITASNREDIRSLYLAVKILNDKGYKTRLIKTGPTDPDFIRSFAFNLDEFVTDLGIVPRSDLPRLLSLADVCVQPGAADAFNQFRLPSKLPEFLACGKPVITTAANLGLRLTDNEHCLLLQTGSPEEIADKCLQLFDTPSLSVTLAQNSRKFAEANFDLNLNTTGLLEFYELIRAQPSGNWSNLHGNRASLFEALPSRIEKLETIRPVSEILSAAKALLEKRESLDSREPEPSLEREPEDRIDPSLERIHALETEKAILDDKVRRMQKSFSWRITAPLRALRRALIDPKHQSNTAEATDSVPADTDISTKPRHETPLQSIPDSEPSEPLPGPPPAYRDYSDFCVRMEPLISEYMSNFEARLDRFENLPMISIILPVYNTSEKWLSDAINSVINQIYPNWELCIADDASTDPKIRELLERYKEIDDRIRVVYREDNGHISAASNSAISIAEGHYIALLDHDDTIPPHALARIVDCITENPNAKIIYTDEDKIDENGERSSPHFKSDWNPDLLLGQNFISHFGVYLKSEVDAVGGFRVGYEGAQDWDLALRISERCTEGDIIHIPEALYHWRSISGSTALDIGEKNYAHETAGKAIRDALRRRGSTAQIEPVERYYWRVIHPTPNPEPLVSIIIPTRDQVDLLKNCIDSIKEKTTYRNYNFIIVDNNSEQEETHDFLESLKSEGQTVIHSPGPFNFNALNNKAIRLTSASFVCLLNNDITVIEPDWLTEMVRHASRLPIGVVGAKLLYPHNHVQHAGVVLGIGGIASEAFKKLHLDDDGYIHRAHLVGNYSAVTGACMMFRKSVWDEVGSFNETDVPNAFGDIDFCLRVRKAGYRVLFTPFALLYHHESASRGNDLEPSKVEAFQKAEAYMKTNWGDIIRRDPHYNPNLTLSREDFTLVFPPRQYSTK